VDITNPQTWNRYAYALNNPTSYIDPSGLFVNDCSWDDCYGGMTYSGGAACTLDGLGVSCGSLGGLGSNAFGFLPAGMSTVTPVPGGYVFPSIGADGSISYSFSSDYTFRHSDGSLQAMNPDWVAEYFGLPTDAAGSHGM
jgi:hypothetical protein